MEVFGSSKVYVATSLTSVGTEAVGAPKVGAEILLRSIVGSAAGAVDVFVSSKPPPHSDVGAGAGPAAGVVVAVIKSKPPVGVEAD